MFDSKLIIAVFGLVVIGGLLCHGKQSRIMTRNEIERRRADESRYPPGRNIHVDAQVGTASLGLTVNENMSVRDFAYKACDSIGIGRNHEHLRVESHFGMTYNMDKSLKEAGIHDDSRVKVKFYSRAEDVGAHLLGMLPGSGSY